MLTLTFDGPIANLTLDDGKGNALGMKMLTELEHALDKAREARVLVIRGREKVFCGGLDLPELIDFPRSAAGDFVALFDRVHEMLLTFPRAIVTAARGSAIAGGAILLSAGDARLVTPQGKTGLIEVALGLSFPVMAFELVRLALGERNITEAATLGRLYDGEDRVRIGFATEIVAPERLDARAQEIAQEYARVDPSAVAQIRQQLRRTAIERARANREADREVFLDRWFSPEGQAGLRAVVSRLAGRQA
jgi:enoyl-CoA hydratase